MLEVESLEAGYDGSRVLWGVDLAVAPAERLALVGRNGAGKSVFLRTVMGLHPAEGGRIRIGGEDFTRRPAHARVAAGVAYVPQGRGIFPRLTVRENLRIAGALSLEPAVALFPKLGVLLDRMGGNLSGGEQQQLAIARALLLKPRLLLLDEPTEGVQPSVIFEIEAALRRIAAEGVAVLLVEQYLEFAWSFADRYAVLEKGRIVAEGRPSDADREEVERRLHV